MAKNIKIELKGLEIIEAIENGGNSVINLDICFDDNFIEDILHQLNQKEQFEKNLKMEENVGKINLEQ